MRSIKKEVMCLAVGMLMVGKLQALEKCDVSVGAGAVAPIAYGNNYVRTSGGASARVELYGRLQDWFAVGAEVGVHPGLHVSRLLVTGADFKIEGDKDVTLIQFGIGFKLGKKAGAGEMVPVFNFVSGLSSRVDDGNFSGYGEKSWDNGVTTNKITARGVEKNGPTYMLSSGFGVSYGLSEKSSLNLLLRLMYVDEVAFVNPMLSIVF